MRAFLVLLLVASIARADEAPNPTLPRTIDLRPIAMPAEPAGLHLTRRSAIVVRNTGIALTIAGTIATIAGTAALATYGYGSGAGLSYENTLGLGAGGMTAGAVGIGVGAGMWAYGALEVGRADGRVPALTPQMRLRRGRGMTIAGGLLTGMGLVLTAASIGIALAPHSCDGGDDFCGLGNALGGGITGGIASTFVAAGLPILGVGISETRKGRAGITIDTIGPRVMPSGGGIGIGGRF